MPPEKDRQTCLPRHGEGRAYRSSTVSPPSCMRLPFPRSYGASICLLSHPMHSSGLLPLTSCVLSGQVSAPTHDAMFLGSPKRLDKSLRRPMMGGSCELQRCGTQLGGEQLSASCKMAPSSHRASSSSQKGTCSLRDGDHNNRTGPSCCYSPTPCYLCLLYPAPRFHHAQPSGVPDCSQSLPPHHPPHHLEDPSDCCEPNTNLGLQEINLSSCARQWGGA